MLDASHPLTLVTGANGAIGFPVVVHALKANYSVRAVVRSQAKADLILAAPSIQSLPESTRSRLSFAIVPDLLSPNAYDEALKDVIYAIHVASPIPGKVNLGPDEFEEHMIRPAVEGTMNILAAAERANVKRVVVTSSVVAVIPIGSHSTDGIVTYNEKSRAPDPVAPYASDLPAYRASKILALNASERWANNGGKGRRVELVNVFPALVVGANELQHTKAELNTGSNGWVVHQFSSETPFPSALSGNVIGVQDIAELHVRGLDQSRVPNGQGLVGAAHGIHGIQWTDGKAIIEKAFPKAVEKGILPNKSWAKESTLMSFDTSETERIADIKFQPFETSLVELAGQYLDVIGEKRE